MLTDQERQQIKAKMEEDLLTLHKSIANLEEITKPIGPDRALGKVGRIDAMMSKSMHEANLNQAEFRYDQLVAAYKRLEDKDFGLCQWCNEPIDFDRLLVLPESTKCIRCA